MLMINKNDNLHNKNQRINTAKPVINNYENIKLLYREREVEKIEKCGEFANDKFL